MTRIQEAQVAQHTRPADSGTDKVVRTLNDNETAKNLAHHDTFMRVHPIQEVSHERRMLYQRHRHLKLCGQKAKDTVGFPLAAPFSGHLEHVFTEAERLAACFEIPDPTGRVKAVTAYLDEFITRWRLAPQTSRPGLMKTETLERIVQELLSLAPNMRGGGTETPTLYTKIFQVAEFELYLHERTRQETENILWRFVVARYAPPVFDETQEVGWFTEEVSMPKAGGRRFEPGFGRLL